MNNNYTVEHIIESNEVKSYEWVFKNFEEAEKKFVSLLSNIKIERAIKVKNFDVHFVSPNGEEKIIIKQ